MSQIRMGFDKIAQNKIPTMANCNLMEIILILRRLNQPNIQSDNFLLFHFNNYYYFVSAEKTGCHICIKKRNAKNKKGSTERTRISLLQKAVEFVSKSDALKYSQTKSRFEIVIRRFNRINKSFFCVILSLFSSRCPSHNQYNVTVQMNIHTRNVAHFTHPTRNILSI